jgi:hypothetical protein
MMGDHKYSIRDVTVWWRRSRTGTAVPCPYRTEVVGARHCRARTADLWTKNFPDNRAPIKAAPPLHIRKTNGWTHGAKIDFTCEGGIIS